MEEVTKSLIIDKNKSIPVSNFADDPELLHWRWTGQELGVHVRPVPTHQRFDSHLQTARLLRLSVPLQPTCIEQQPRHRSRHISPQRIACTDHTSYTHSRIGSLQSRLLLLARQDNYELQLPIPRPISRRQNPHQQLDILLPPSPSFSPCLSLLPTFFFSHSHGDPANICAGLDAPAALFSANDLFTISSPVQEQEYRPRDNIQSPRHSLDPSRHLPNYPTRPFGTSAIVLLNSVDTAWPRRATKARRGALGHLHRQGWPGTQGSCLEGGQSARHSPGP